MSASVRVLRAAGYDAAAIRRLRDLGVVA